MAEDNPDEQSIEEDVIQSAYSILFLEGELIFNPIQGTDDPILTYLGDTALVSVHARKAIAIVTNQKTKKRATFLYGEQRGNKEILECPNGKELTDLAVELRSHFAPDVANGVDSDTITDELDQKVTEKAYWMFQSLVDTIEEQSGLFTDE